MESLRLFDVQAVDRGRAVAAVARLLDHDFPKVALAAAKLLVEMERANAAILLADHPHSADVGQVHAAIDRLTPDQLTALYALRKQLVGSPTAAETVREALKEPAYLEHLERQRMEIEPCRNADRVAAALAILDAAGRRNGLPPLATDG